jgi:hypothetical protein
MRSELCRPWSNGWQLTIDAEEYNDILSDEIDEMRKEFLVGCDCEWQQIITLCKTHLVPAKFPWAISDFLDNWLRRISPGTRSSETALVLTVCKRCIPSYLFQMLFTVKMKEKREGGCHILLLCLRAFHVLLTQGG